MQTSLHSRAWWVARALASSRQIDAVIWDGDRLRGRIDRLRRLARLGEGIQILEDVIRTAMLAATIPGPHTRPFQGRWRPVFP